MSARSAALDRTSRAVGHRSPVVGGEWTGQTSRGVDYRQTTVAHPAFTFARESSQGGQLLGRLGALWCKRSAQRPTGREGATD